MITIRIPRNGNEVFIKAVDQIGCLTGPIQFPGQKFDDIIYRHFIDRLGETRGLHHENYCDHVELKADLSYIPTASSIVSCPIDGSPNRVSYNNVYYNYGWRRPGVVCGNATNAVAYYPKEGYGFTTVWAWLSSAGKLKQLTELDFTYVSHTASNITYSMKKRWKGWSSYKTIPTPTYQGLLDLVAQYLASSNWGTPSNTTSAFILGKNAPWITEAMAHATVYTAWHEVSDYPSTLTKMPWRDLAVQASENFKVVKFNALEFISDLKDPKAMIPKLRNIRRLKDAADVYLSTHFGLLPTVDDLHGLYNSLVKLKKNVDRNGYQTTSAGYIASEVVGPYTHTLEQHCKLAIDSEDSRVQALVTGLENYGIMPNASTLWELIPFSFAVDWIANIGGYLEDIDNNRRLARFNVRYCTVSVKKTWSRIYDPVLNSGYSGTVQAIHYDRAPTSWVPKSDPSLSVPLNVSGHWLEAGALIVQRLK